MFNSWINNLLTPLHARDASGLRRRKPKAKHAGTQLRLEVLETRNLLAAVMVTNSGDELGGDIRSIDALISDPGPDGTISLREAIMASNRTPGANTINFDRLTSGVSIQFTDGRPLVINNSVTIAGLGADKTSVKAADGAPIFVVQTTFADPGAVTLDGLLLTGCKGSYGAIVAQFAYLTVSNSVIAGNDVRGFGSAGGINSLSHLTVINSTISGNLARDGVGGISAQGDLTVINSNISGKTGYNGGIIGSDVTITDSTIAGNTALRSGGGIEARGRLTVSGSTISGNSANYSGAGINVRRGASVKTSNSTISGNVGFGGGIFAEELTVLSIGNSTISGNSTDDGGYGGGIFTSGDITLDSSIVAGNVFLGDGGSPDLYSDSWVVTATHSLIGDNSGSGLEPTAGGVPDASGNFVGAADAILDPHRGVAGHIRRRWPAAK